MDNYVKTVKVLHHYFLEQIETDLLLKVDYHSIEQDCRIEEAVNRRIERNINNAVN